VILAKIVNAVELTRTSVRMAKMTNMVEMAVRRGGADKIIKSVNDDGKDGWHGGDGCTKRRADKIIKSVNDGGKDGEHGEMAVRRGGALRV
jgi:hypothetical protein